eukprot:462422-Pleurochrysis_carterae.AAC.2
MIYKYRTEQPLQGRARFESVARINSFNQARLSWRAFPNLILYGGSYQSYHPGGQERRVDIKYIPSGAGSKCKRGGWDAPGRWFEEVA